MKLSAAAFAVLMLAGTQANAATLVENFDNPFGDYQTRWFGANSNAQECYGPGDNRGNNPDGLWVSTVGQGCNGAPVTVTFTQPFASSLSSFAMDVAGYSPTTLTFFDAAGTVLSSNDVTLTYGAYGNPGTYVRYGVSSTSGIGGFSFSGDAAGNTSIDNLVAVTGLATPEPASWAMMVIGFGAVGAALRGRRKTALRLA